MPKARRMLVALHSDDRAMFNLNVPHIGGDFPLKGGTLSICHWLMQKCQRN
jgi:hypothetical protein